MWRIIRILLITGGVLAVCFSQDSQFSTHVAPDLPLIFGAFIVGFIFTLLSGRMSLIGMKRSQQWIYPSLSTSPFNKLVVWQFQYFATLLFLVIGFTGLILSFTRPGFEDFILYLIFGLGMLLASCLLKRFFRAQFNET